MDKKEKQIAYCGLDCNKCPAYIATKHNDDNLREKTAKEWTERYRSDGRDRPPVKPEDINCEGCLSSGLVYLHCHECKIRNCAMEKRVKNCKECAEYKCAELDELQSHFF
ncbi:MAG: DUF3795 domain-containing protein [Candidatus Cloacimonetes bacterium]|nr:DUF3795 domain-containing protein [Candidatus Cloacimonadota bacterium]